MGKLSYTTSPDVQALLEDNKQAIKAKANLLKLIKQANVRGEGTKSEKQKYLEFYNISILEHHIRQLEQRLRINGSEIIKKRQHAYDNAVFHSKRNNIELSVVKDNMASYNNRHHESIVKTKKLGE